MHMIDARWKSLPALTTSWTHRGGYHILCVPLKHWYTDVVLYINTRKLIGFIARWRIAAHLAGDTFMEFVGRPGSRVAYIYYPKWKIRIKIIYREDSPRLSSKVPKKRGDTSNSLLHTYASTISPTSYEVHSRVIINEALVHLFFIRIAVVMYWIPEGTPNISDLWIINRYIHSLVRGQNDRHI